MNNDYKIKIVIIGDSNVGKSNILTKFIDDEFKSEISPTFGVDYKSTIVNCSNKLTNFTKPINVVMWDCAGQERFKSITKSFYNIAHIIIICFDLTDIFSFESVDVWYQEIIKSNILNPIIILVGNKSDLTNSRVVSKELGLKKATKLKLQGYFETSAKTSEGLEELFHDVVKIYCEYEELKYNKQIEKTKLTKFNTNNINNLDNVNNVNKKNFLCYFYK